jgi:hypothetical protein
MDKPNKKWWQKWMKLERLIPLGTVLGGFIAILLATLGVIQMSIPEGIILSLVGLLAADALIERMDVLEKIKQELDLLNNPHNLEPRLTWEHDVFKNEPFEKYLQGAKELFISGGSLIGFIRDQKEILEKWLYQTPDAKLKLIMVDPKLVRAGRISVDSLYRDRDANNSGQENFARETESALERIAAIQKKFYGKVEVRLTTETPSVTVMIVDRVKARVSVNLLRGYPTNRPAFAISKDKYPDWFGIFDERYYTELWSNSKEYK